MARVTLIAPTATAGEPARGLEAGEIVAFPTPALLSNSDLSCLRAPHHIAGAHKNIAYDARRDRMIGVSSGAGVEGLQRALRAYAKAITALTARLLPAYADKWTVDLTSFRPLEEAERQLSDRSRNDRLHIDAFPSRPTSGDRILRVFTNVHAADARIWLTGPPLHRQLPMLRQLPGFPMPKPGAHAVGPSRRLLAQWLRLPVLARSPYDRFMLRLHDFMKQSGAYQEQCGAERHEFAPDTSWIVFTDIVPHAVVSGQYALEQTFFVPHTAIQNRADAPLTLFETLRSLPGAT